MAAAIVLEGALSFLGVGAPPPAATWGEILREAQIDLRIAGQLLAVGLQEIIRAAAKAATEDEIEARPERAQCIVERIGSTARDRPGRTSAGGRRG